jgi:protein kinase C substrate 80K-H
VSPLSPGDVGASASPRPSLPGFYCRNAGHRPSYIPFTHVNDGVCDYERCCDGSDEWMTSASDGNGSGGGGNDSGGRDGAAAVAVCENRCKEIGKAWRAQHEARTKTRAAGRKRRGELVAQATALRKRLQDDLVVLEAKVQTAERKAAALQAELSAVEQREAAAAAARGRRRRDGKGGKEHSVSELAEQAKTRVEELREALLRVQRQRDDERAKVRELEGILSTFKAEYNPNFNDDGVKHAVRSWEEYAAARKPQQQGDQESDEHELDEILKPDSQDNGIDWARWQTADDIGEEDEDLSYTDAGRNRQNFSSSPPFHIVSFDLYPPLLPPKSPFPNFSHFLSIGGLPHQYQHNLRAISPCSLLLTLLAFSSFPSMVG